MKAKLKQFSVLSALRLMRKMPLKSGSWNMRDSLIATVNGRQKALWRGTTSFPISSLVILTLPFVATVSLSLSRSSFRTISPAVNNLRWLCCWNQQPQWPCRSNVGKQRMRLCREQEQTTLVWCIHKTNASNKHSSWLFILYIESLTEKCNTRDEQLLANAEKNDTKKTLATTLFWITLLSVFVLAWQKCSFMERRRWMGRILLAKQTWSAMRDPLSISSFYKNTALATWNYICVHKTFAKMRLQKNMEKRAAHNSGHPACHGRFNILSRAQ